MAPITMILLDNSESLRNGSCSLISSTVGKKLITGYHSCIIIIIMHISTIEYLATELTADYIAGMRLLSFYFQLLCHPKFSIIYIHTKTC